MTYLWILLAVSLLVSAVGWKYFIYFFSLGYGYGPCLVRLAISPFLKGIHMVINRGRLAG